MSILIGSILTNHVREMGKESVGIIGTLEKLALPTMVLAIVLFGYTMAVFVLSPAVFSITNIFFYINFALIHFQGYCLITSYYKCCTSDPGFVKMDWNSKFTKEDMEEIMSIERKTKNGHDRICEKCGVLKPPRTHHSRLQNQCVKRMDHYCVWVGNCIGAFNHKYFILFLFYFTTAAFHWYFLMINTVYLFVMDFYRIHIAFLIMCGLFSCMVFPLSIVVVMFTGFHFWLLITNQTSVEYSKNGLLYTKFTRSGRLDQYKRVFDLGWLNNVKQVMGKNVPEWFLPYPSDMDGIHFQTIPHDEITKFNQIVEEMNQLKTVLYQGELN
jgi:hypothetical protein